MKLKSLRRIVWLALFCIVFAFAAGADPAFAKKKGKTKGKKKRKKGGDIAVTYTGQGSVSLVDQYSDKVSTSECRRDSVEYTENITNVSWSVGWDDFKLVEGANHDSDEAIFAASTARIYQGIADLSHCPPFQLNDCNVQSPRCVVSTSSCHGSLEYVQGIYPEMLVKKSGGGFLLTIVAENLFTVAQHGTSNSLCASSTAFDNSMVGLNVGRLTKTSFVVKPTTKKKTTLVEVPLVDVVDCSDPARAPYFTGTCTVTNGLVGYVEIKGKWSIPGLEPLD